MAGHVRKVGASWRAMYSLTVNGKRTQPSQCFATKREAQTWLNEQLAKRDRNASSRDPLKMTFGQWFEQWLRIRQAEGAAASTLVAARSTMRNYGSLLCSMRLAAVTTADVNDVLIEVRTRTSRRGQPLAPSTVQRFKSVLHAIFATAIATGALTGGNPVSGALRIPQQHRKPTAWSNDEVTAFLGWLETAGVNRGGRPTGAAHHLLPTFATLVLTGLRWGELLDLQWSDVDLAAGTISVDSSYSIHEGSKGTKSQAGARIVPIGRRLLPILTGHRKAANELRIRLGSVAPDHDLVFVSPELNRLGYSSANQALTRLIERAQREGLDLRRIPSKALRSSFASSAGAAGATGRDIADLLGHADGGVTAMRNYVASSLDRQRELLDLVDGGSSTERRRLG